MPMMTPTRNLKSTIAAIALLLSISIGGAPCKAQDDEAANTSRFVKEVLKDEYRKTDPPATAPVFRWDFSKADGVSAYSYTQEVSNSTTSALWGNSGPMRQEISGNGVLLVRSQGNGTAEMVLKDMKMSMKIGAGLEGPKTMEQQMPPIAIQGVKEDGSGSCGDSPQYEVFKDLFPLPPQTLMVGESVDVPAQMPFNVSGSVLKVTGHTRITLAQYVDIGGKTCAQFNVDTYISDLKIPPEMEGEYKFSSRDTSVYYFDVASREFISGTIASMTQFSIDAPMPQIDMPGENTSDLPKRAQMSMQSDNLVRVKLQE
ncbi:MAG: hypothetical protein HZB23_01830 [Deltaproteobacteria bacterium]|nr:hypothetical protein [Deltaproteobacteria bacterium]